MRNYETKTFDYVDKETGAHVVKATTTYAGRTVSAFAKCIPSDTFDLQFGKDVAIKRLEIKIAQKRAASMKRRADMYEKVVEDFERQIRFMKSEIEKARIAEGDRRVEISDLEAELDKMLH